MRGTKAKRLRRERVAKGLPKFKEPIHNFTDLEDTRSDRRLKKNRKRYEHELRQTDYQKQRKTLHNWRVVLLYLFAHKTFRPYLEKFPGDPSQESRMEAYEAMLAKRNEETS